MLSLGCFYLELSDAIKEGDGERVLRYSVEALNMLCQYQYDFSPRLAQELIWSRFISTHSSPGRNIPEDLHQEHLNRLVKESIRGLGANKTEAAITRVGKALGSLFPVIQRFDEENGVHKPSGALKLPSVSKDRDLIIKHLLKCDVFSTHNNSTFAKPKDFLHSINHDTILAWITSHL